jgi:hypothetical protein
MLIFAGIAGRCNALRTCSLDASDRARQRRDRSSRSSVHGETRYHVALHTCMLQSKVCAAAQSHAGVHSMMLRACIPASTRLLLCQPLCIPHAQTTVDIAVLQSGIVNARLSCRLLHLSSAVCREGKPDRPESSGPKQESPAGDERLATESSISKHESSLPQRRSEPPSSIEGTWAEALQTWRSGCATVELHSSCH